MLNPHDKKRVDLNHKWKLPCYFKPPITEKMLCALIGVKTTFEGFQILIRKMIGESAEEIKLVEISTATHIDEELLEKCVDFVAAELPHVQISVRSDMDLASFWGMLSQNLAKTCYYYGLIN